MGVAVSEADLPFDMNMLLLRQNNSSHSILILSTHGPYKSYVLRITGSTTFSDVNKNLEGE